MKILIKQRIYTPDEQTDYHTWKANSQSTNWLQDPQLASLNSHPIHSQEHQCVNWYWLTDIMLIIASNFSAYLFSSGSPLCSATPGQLLCAPGVPQFFASPLEAVQGLPSFFVPLKSCLHFLSIKLYLVPLLTILDPKALLCFCVSRMEASASKRAEISQTYGGVGFCNSVPHCKAGTCLV